MSQKINDTFDECFWGEYLESQGSRLPQLPDVERITPRVVRVLAGNPGGVSPLLYKINSMTWLLMATYSSNCRVPTRT